MKEWILRKAALLMFRLADRVATRWHYHSARLLKAAQNERVRKQVRKIIRAGQVIQAGR